MNENDWLNGSQPKKKSTKIKFAESVLGLLQVIAYLLAFFFYLQLMGDVLRHFGAGDDAGAYGWGITIGLCVFIGWLLETSGKIKY